MNQTRREENIKQRETRRRHFLSYKRRWALWGTLLILISLLITYNTFTQDHRVRAFLERELSEIVGGPVSVEKASFSLSGGLQVSDVTISVGPQRRDDSELVKAEKLNVWLDYSRLLQFKIDIERVEAEHVRIQLVEDPADKTWNFQRLLQKNDRSPDQPRQQLQAPTMIPGIYIQDALVTYQRRIDGKLQAVGTVAINATLFPLSPRSYGFNIITDPSSSRKNVHLIGSLSRDTDEITGRISELNIDHALREMLPSRVRDWFIEYDFTGRFSVPMFRYHFRSPSEVESFELTLDYKDARSTVQPRHWLTRKELWRMALVRETIQTFKMLGMNQPIPHDKPLTDSDADVVPTDLVSYLQVETRPIPLYLTNVTGQTTFTKDKVTVNNECSLQGQQLVIQGELQGYSADAAGTLSIKTKPGTHIQIPPSQQFMAWVPDDVRKPFMEFKPRGKGVLGVQLTRTLAGGPFDPVVVLDLFDSQLEFDEFPYPLQQCQGSFIFSHDSEKNQDLLRIQNLRGVGVPEGPNATSVVEINGIIGPFIKGGPGIDVRVKGRDISSEPRLREAFPKDVAKAMALFGPLDYGHRLAAAGVKKMELSPEEAFDWPHFFGDFDVRVLRSGDPLMKKRPVDTHVELRLKKATGTLKLFPYPMHDLTVVVSIHNDFLEIHNLEMNRNGASLKLDGKVSFSDPINPDIQVDARNVPLDDDLLDALPPTERSWLKRAGLGGRVDIKGRIFLKELTEKGDSEVDFDLDLRAHDATLLKDANGPAITGLNGDMHLKPARLQFDKLSGRRNDGSIAMSGAVDWQNGMDVALTLNARDLLLDHALRDILPAAVQESWNQHRPEGTTDLDLDYFSFTPPDDKDAAKAPAPTTQPTEKLKLALRPRKMSAMTEVFPYRLDDLQGEIIVDDKHVRLINLKGRHGATLLQVNADGITGPAMDFNLNVLATNVNPDRDLMAALPESLVEVIKGIAAEGLFSIRFDKLHVRDAAPSNSPRAAPVPRPATATGRPASTQPVDVDFDCTVTSTGTGKVDVGFPVTDIFGWAQLIGEVREEGLTKLNGSINADAYKLLGRSGSNLTATLRRPDYAEGLLVQSLRTTLAGGSVAGDVTIVSHGDSPSQYAVEAVVQNADLAEVVGPTTKAPMQGKLSASFDVEGIFGDTRNRRGRGRIQIHGKDMYEAPIILGFFRLVNFALPLRDGVNDVDVSYTLMRDQATFDSIELSAPGLRIYGDGVLDFAKHEMNLTLNTENPDAWTLPLLNGLVRRAREELLQIRIKGSLEEPKVQALTFPTFQTTLDQVVQDVKESRK